MARLKPFYQFAHATKLPTPGAMAMGFESEMLAWRPFIGPGIAARFQFATITRQAGSYQAASMAWLTGLTAPVHGQMALTPLSVPDNG